MPAWGVTASAIRSKSVTFSLTDREIADIELGAARNHMNRSRYVAWVTGRDVNGDRPAGTMDVAPGSEMAAVMRAAAERPGVDGSALRLIAAVTGLHMDELRGGVLPMVDTDAVHASLDPHGRETYRLYMDDLPGIFEESLGSRPRVDIRYAPLDTVDGEYVGSVVGSVLSHREVYPGRYDTNRHVQLLVQTPRQKITALVPTGHGADDVSVGLRVYVAGVFESSRGGMTLHATTCSVCRFAGFDEVYDLADRWGVDDMVSGRAVAMLFRAHGADAPRYSRMFARFLTLDRSAVFPDVQLRTPDGEQVTVRTEDARDAPDGPEAFMQCTDSWPGLVERARRFGAMPRVARRVAE